MNTLAIIGSHPRTRQEFDFKRDDCDIWVFNEAMSGGTFPRADAVLQMHEEAIWRNPTNRNDPHHIDWLKSQDKIPVLMQEVYEDVPKSQRFPLDEIIASVQNIKTVIDYKKVEFKYFSSSVDYALAYAAYLHKEFGQYNKVELYGVEMETNTEYQYQRTGVAFWLGYLGGMGLNVEYHGTIFDFPLYGYEGEVVMPYERFDERITQLQPEVDRLTAAHRAKYIELNKAIDIFAAHSGTKEETLLMNNVDAIRSLGRELGELDGRLQENKRYKKKADAMKENADDEFLFSRQEFETAAHHLTKKHDNINTEFITIGTKVEILHKNIMQAPKGSKKRAAFVSGYKEMIKNYFQLNNLLAIHKGAAQENYDFMAYMDKHIKAAGGEKSEAVLLEKAHAMA